VAEERSRCGLYAGDRDVGAVLWAKCISCLLCCGLCFAEEKPEGDVGVFVAEQCMVDNVIEM